MHALHKTRKPSLKIPLIHPFKRAVNFHLAVTYLQVPVQVCFSSNTGWPSSTAAYLVFPILLALLVEKGTFFSCDLEL